MSSTPVEYGYQHLPTLVPGRVEGLSRPHPISYSWPRTQAIIDGEVARLAVAERVLDTVIPAAGPTSIARSAASRKPWRVETAADRFGVDVEIRRLAPEMLYEGAAVAARGASIDIEAHVEQLLAAASR